MGEWGREVSWIYLGRWLIERFRGKEIRRKKRFAVEDQVDIGWEGSLRY